MLEKSKYKPYAELLQQKVPMDKTELKGDCYNCDEMGHNAKNCLSKDKGTKCCRCNNLGHISQHCPQKDESANVRSLVSVDNLWTTRRQY